ncbi:MAG: methyl-accepting chemotaxis protein, partial [Bacteroidales bacterium]|nr:methyl-accepting chemotaxis protein [Bacteroidales bacterium]
MKKIKNILSRIFSGSRIARIINLLFISMGVVMTVVFFIIFLLYNKKIMDEAGTKSMNDLSTRCAEDIQHEMAVYLGQTMSIVTAQTMSINGALSGQLRRDDITAILNGYFRHTDVLVGGVKWEPNAFDGADDQYKDDPLFSAYNGELNIFFVREDSTTIVHKPNYQLDPALYNQIRKNPVGQIMHAEFITVAGQRVLALPLAVPFIARDRKTFLGAFIEYIPVTRFNDIARKFKEQTDIEMAEVIFDNNFIIIADAQNPANNGKRLGEVYGKASEHPEVFNSPESHLIDEMGISHHANVLNCGGGDNKWVVLFSTYTYNFSKNLYGQIRTFAIIAFVLLLITLIIATIIGNMIGRPISQMIQGCRQIAKGNINVSFNHNDIKGSTEITELFSAFDDMAKNIRRIVSDVKQSAQNVNSAGKELSKSASMMAQGANQQASASEQVSTAMDEMTASIQKNAVNAKETEDITNKVVQSVQIANKSVGTTAEAMKNI